METYPIQSTGLSHLDGFESYLHAFAEEPKGDVTLVKVLNRKHLLSIVPCWCRQTITTQNRRIPGS